MEKRLLAAIQHLSKADPVIKNLIQQHGPCTLFEKNGLWHKPKFHVLCWAIINQQLSVRSAQSIENKLLNRLPGKLFELRSIISLDNSELASCGLSRQKIRYLRALCEAVQSGQLALEKLENNNNETVSTQLTALPGIGPWTVDMFLIFSLGRLDVLPLGDLALRKAISLHYSLPEKTPLQEYQAIASAWRPYQTIASWYLWASVD